MVLDGRPVGVAELTAREGSQLSDVRVRVGHGHLRQDAALLGRGYLLVLSLGSISARASRRSNSVSALSQKRVSSFTGGSAAARASHCLASRALPSRCCVMARNNQSCTTPLPPCSATASFSRARASPCRPA